METLTQLQIKTKELDCQINYLQIKKQNLTEIGNNLVKAGKVNEAHHILTNIKEIEKNIKKLNYEGKSIE